MARFISLAGARSSRVAQFSAVLCGLSAVVLADQVLEIHANSLTTYLAGRTQVQDVRPRADQRGVELDGRLRRPSTHPLALAGNPFEPDAPGQAELNGVRLDTGTWSPTRVDLSFPAEVPWVIGRTYNARQDSPSNGYQGFNWMQTSQPEIVLYDDADNSLDTLYLVYGADRFAEFKRTGNSAETYKATNGAAGMFERTSGSPDTWVYYAPDAMTATFFGFNTSDADHKGQIWKIANADGDVAFVGSTTSASAAISAGYDSAGRITAAFDSAGREFVYTYSPSTIGGTERLESVIATLDSVEIGRVAYGYYPDSPSSTFGSPGDLQTATVTLPLTQSGVDDVRVEYLRYYVGEYNSSSNRGYPHMLKLVLEPEGTRLCDWAIDSNFNGTYLSETTTNLKQHASVYFEYDAYGRVDTAWFNGQCGCGSSGSGTHNISYEASGSATSAGYDNVSARRTVIDQPDNAWIVQYFDETGQALTRAVFSGNPSGSPAPTSWITWVERDGMGCVTQVGTPASVSAYNHSTWTVSKAVSGGLVRVYARVASGDAKGFVADELWRNGTAATSPENTQTYVSSLVWWTNKATKSFNGGSNTLVRPLLKENWQYPTATTTQYASSATKTAHDYTTHSGASLAIETHEETLPAVSAGKNGSGSSHVVSMHFLANGLSDFRTQTNDAGNAIVEYRSYTNGQLTQVRTDANTSSLSPPTGFAHTGTALNDVTSFEYDAQGRETIQTSPDGINSKTYYSRLGDRRSITVHFPRFTSHESIPEGSGEYCGPVTFQVGNQACGVEAEGTLGFEDGNGAVECLTFATGIDLLINENAADPIAAIEATVLQLRTATFSGAGAVQSASRTYSAIPSSLPGTAGTHYDETGYGHDEMGHRTRSQAPHGTITRTVYDERGLATATWIGTNDASFPGGASGTDNMVKVEDRIFDVNGYMTKNTAYVDDTTTDKRETNFTNDLFGSAVLIANPTAPHTFNEYDNLGRLLASAQFSSTASISVGSDDPTTETANRLALSEQEYDERGRVWRSVHHEIDGSDGSDDDELESLTWFDKLGRVAKQDGEQLAKFAYDRLNRQTRRFVLASALNSSGDPETAYADAITVADDLMLEESQSGYDIEGHELISVRLARNYNNFGTGKSTGELDTNADGTLLTVTAGDIAAFSSAPGSRAQITAKWYDALGRIEDVVEFGTNHASANVDTLVRLDLVGSENIPARSDTALRTSYAYNTDGTLKQVTDPKGLITRYEYDAMGRRTAVIANYVDGTPGGGGDGDEDQVVRYAYTNGLQVSITADLPSGETDQVTTYTFGTVKGTSAGDSKIATGHLLQKVQYPDSSDSTNDIVAYAYNAQSEEIWRRDQATAGNASDFNIITTEYDTSGRETNRRVTQKRSAVDGAVMRIGSTYDALGRTELVTQYSAATGGSVVNEVKYSYDGWRNIAEFAQDPDSAVGTGTSWSVAYSHAKATGGRNTIRREKMDLPGGFEVDYVYRSTGGRLDADASRVTQITDGNGTPLAVYQYNGVGMVVRTDLEEVDLFSRSYGTAAAFTGLDRFNRTLVSRWTKILSTNRDIYKVTLGYDRNSNVTSQDDVVHTGHDVVYSNDKLNRLVRAREGENWTGSAFATETRDQRWTLNQTGNWKVDKVDLDGDGDFSDPGDLNDTRVHNDVNELVSRDTDSNSSTNFTLAYDAAGNMTDDDESYQYEWDAFGRLRKVRNQSDVLVSEYWYNGLGFLVKRHQDTDSDGDVDGDDKVYHSVYDERWRQVATYRDGDSHPKERFIYHAAGNGGYGGSSYIDLVVMRDRDVTNGWTGAADGTLEERVYYCQNWRADVVALVDGEKGSVLEWAKYSAYGVPFGVPAGDANSDGNCNSTDDSIVFGWISSGYDVRGDMDLDGDVDTADHTAVQNGHQDLGRGVLTAVVVGNRKGYAAYELDWYRGLEWHTRHRVLHSVMGTWLTRDRMGYIDSGNLYSYVDDRPVGRVDSQGLMAETFVGDPGVTCTTKPRLAIWPFWPDDVDSCIARCKKLSGAAKCNCLCGCTYMDTLRGCFDSWVKCEILVAVGGGAAGIVADLVGPIVTGIGDMVCTWEFKGCVEHAYGGFKICEEGCK